MTTCLAPANLAIAAAIIPIGACACDQHILSEHIIGKSCMSSVSERIKNRITSLPGCSGCTAIHWKLESQDTLQCTVSVYADALCVLAVFFVSFQTVPALSTCDMSFTGYQVSYFESLYAQDLPLRPLLHTHVRLSGRSGSYAVPIHSTDKYVRLYRR